MISCVYRAEKKSLQILLSRTQAGPGRKVKQEQEEISHNHVPRLFLGSVSLVLSQIRQAPQSPLYPAYPSTLQQGGGGGHWPYKVGTLRECFVTYVTQLTTNLRSPALARTYRAEKKSLYVVAYIYSWSCLAFLPGPAWL